MPEWPEMETYRMLLSPRLCGHTIKRVIVNRPESVNEPEETFRRSLLSRRILFVEHRGKRLILHLDDGNRLMLHLMLGGWLAYGAEGPRKDSHFQVILGFDDGENLYFGGLRLGYLHRLSAKTVNDELKELGPEPFDARLTPEMFRKRLIVKRGKLKAALTDQKPVAGIGNRYADEICFDALLHPEAAVRFLHPEETDRLYRSMRKVLAEAAECGGYMDRPLTPDDTFTGGFAGKFRVYEKEGEPCERCGNPIVKGESSGRKLFYCPHCQRTG